MNRGGARRVRESESISKRGKTHNIKVEDKTPEGGKYEANEVQNSLSIKIKNKRVKEISISGKVHSINILNSEVVGIDFRSFKADVLNIYNSTIKDCQFSSCSASLICLERSVIDGGSKFSSSKSNKYCSYIDLRSANCRETNVFKSDIAEKFVIDICNGKGRNIFPEKDNVKIWDRIKLIEKVKSRYEGQQQKLYGQIKSLYNNMKEIGKRPIKIEYTLKRIKIETSDNIIQKNLCRLDSAVVRCRKILLSIKFKMKKIEISKPLAALVVVVYSIMYYSNISDEFPIAFLHAVSILFRISSPESANTIIMSFAAIEVSVFLFILGKYLESSNS